MATPCTITVANATTIQTPGQFVDAAVAFMSTHSFEDFLGLFKGDVDSVTHAAVARFNHGDFDQPIREAAGGLLFFGIALLVVVLAVLAVLALYGRWVVRRNRRLTGSAQVSMMLLIVALAAVAPWWIQIPVAIHLAVNLKAAATKEQKPSATTVATVCDIDTEKAPLVA